MVALSGSRFAAVPLSERDSKAAAKRRQGVNQADRLKTALYVEF
jgi:hypothetical protein